MWLGQGIAARRTGPRAVLLTLAGWTSSRIAEAFGVREDTVRLWRSDFMRGGFAALKANVAPGPAPVKSEAALRVVTPLLEEPVLEEPVAEGCDLRASLKVTPFATHDLTARRPPPDGYSETRAFWRSPTSASTTSST